MENIKPPDPVVPLTVDELEAELLAEPWLGPYVEVGDIDLNAARVRFEVDQISARRVLIDANVSVALRYRRGALQTTSIDERQDATSAGGTVTVLESRAIEVEDGGRVVVGRLVPYDEPSIVADRGPSGSLMVFVERWDADSVRLPDGPIVVLVGHDDNRPIGRVGRGRLWHQRDGLWMEAVLSGSASEIEGVRARIADDVQSGLSVGFFGSKGADIWSTPTTVGGLPSVLRRDVTVREASLVTWPALSGASVTRVTARTEAQRESDRLLERQHAKQQAKRAEAEQQRAWILAEVATRKAAAVQPLNTEPPVSTRLTPPPRPEPEPEHDEHGMPTYPSHPFPEDGTPAEQARWLRRRDNWVGTMTHLMRNESLRNEHR